MDKAQYINLQQKIKAGTATPEEIQAVKDYEDSLNAVVYRQSPEPSEIPVGLGEDVSLYMTVNPERIPSR